MGIDVQHQGMICEHCGQTIPDRKVRSYVAHLIGKASGKSKARDPEKMRQAALKRWEKTTNGSNQSERV